MKRKSHLYQSICERCDGWRQKLRHFCSFSSPPSPPQSWSFLKLDMISKLLSPQQSCKLFLFDLIYTLKSICRLFSKSLFPCVKFPLKFSLRLKEICARIFMSFQKFTIEFSLIFFFKLLNYKSRSSFKISCWKHFFFFNQRRQVIIETPCQSSPAVGTGATVSASNNSQGFYSFADIV